MPSPRSGSPSSLASCCAANPGDVAYIILDGEADVLVDTPNGQISVAKLGKNDLVGEMAILIDIPRTATVKAIDRVATLAISKDLFFRMVTEFPQMGVEIMRELAHRLENTTAQLREARSRAS